MFTRLFVVKNLLNMADVGVVTRSKYYCSLFCAARAVPDSNKLLGAVRWN